MQKVYKCQCCGKLKYEKIGEKKDYEHIIISALFPFAGNTPQGQDLEKRIKQYNENVYNELNKPTYNIDFCEKCGFTVLYLLVGIK